MDSRDEVYLQWDPLGHSHGVLWSHGTNGMGWIVGIEVYLQRDPLGYSHAVLWSHGSLRTVLWFHVPMATWVILDNYVGRGEEWRAWG